MNPSERITTGKKHENEANTESRTNIEKFQKIFETRHSNSPPLYSVVCPKKMQQLQSESKNERLIREKKQRWIYASVVQLFETNNRNRINTTKSGINQINLVKVMSFLLDWYNHSNGIQGNKTCDN